MDMIIEYARVPSILLETALEKGRAAVLGPRSSNNAPPSLYLFGFSRWKTFMHDWFPDRRVIFAPSVITPMEFNLKWKQKILKDKFSSVMAWQYKGPQGLRSFCFENGIDFHYVEDGFLRSVNLGAMHTRPLSLTFDRQEMHFNAAAPSDLEVILATYDFDNDPDLMERARRGMTELLTNRLSKYNVGADADIRLIYGPKQRKRILVIGQVERDASIAYGCEKPVCNNDIVRLASKENPGAQIIYKPHPEVLHGSAKAQSNPADVSHISLVLQHDINLADALETVDHVYTITSLSGFEALMRGIRVTTIGCPFYSGWGLTDDRQLNPRRVRRLTIDQIFAAAYVLYPKYIDPSGRNRIELEQAIILLKNLKESAASSDFVAKRNSWMKYIFSGRRRKTLPADVSE